MQKMSQQWFQSYVGWPARLRRGELRHVWTFSGPGRNDPTCVQMRPYRATARTRIHLPKLGYELLGRRYFEAGDIPGEGVAIVNRSLPEPRTGLTLAYVLNNVRILGLVQHHAPTRSVLFFQVTVALSGFGGHRHKMTKDIRNSLVDAG
jgi:hypothetical protein